MSHDPRTPKKASEWRPIFLAVLAETANVTLAAKEAGVGRRTAYDHRAQYEGFAAEWDEALEIGVAALEDEANRRAFHGVETPVYQGGELVGHIRKYSDTLAIFLLKAHRPERYTERLATEQSGSLKVIVERKDMYLADDD